LLNEFDADFVVSNYIQKHKEVCGEFGCTSTHSIMIASVPDDDDRFDAILATIDSRRKS